MASSTSRQVGASRAPSDGCAPRPFAFSWLALTLLIVGQSGCWTGTLLSTARLHESVVQYDRVSISEDEIYVDYTVEVSRSPTDAKIREGKRRVRTAIIPLSAIDEEPPHPVDAFPLRRVRRGTEGVGAVRVPITGRTATASMNSKESKADAESSIGGFDSFTAEVTEDQGRPLGFRLCAAAAATDIADATTDAATTDGRCLGFFYSAALYDDRLAWWAYPVAPFAIAFDIILIPIQALTLPPLLVVSD